MKVKSISATILAMLIITLLVIMGAGYAVYSREQPRPGKEIVESAKGRLTSAQADLATAAALPVLGNLDVSWTKVTFILKSCGATFAPMDKSQFDTLAGKGMVYPGPAAAWHGASLGPSISLLSCLLLIGEEYPVILNTITLNGDQANVTFSVLGKLEEPKL